LIEDFLKLPLDIEDDENNVVADSACIQSKALDQLKSTSRLVDRAKTYAIDEIICIRKEGRSEIDYAMDA
jgi:hypothetical protein